MGRGVPICAVVVALALPLTAQAAPVDTASAHKGLTAWVQFTHAGIAQLGAASTAEDALLADVSGRCPGALAALDAVAPETLDWKVLAQVFSETLADADIAASSPLQNPFDAFANRVSRLHWSSRAVRARISRSLQLHRRYLVESGSDLCANANAIALAGGLTVPNGTLQFLTVARRNVTAAGLAGFAQVLARFVAHTKQNAALFRKLESNVSEYQSREMEIVYGAQDKLLRALGLTKPQEIVGQDASTMSDARNMVSNVEACFTDVQDYSRCTTANGPFTNKNTGLDLGSGPGQVEVVNGTKTTYTVVAHSKSGTDFSIDSMANGSVTRRCSRPGVALCGADGTW